MPETASSTSRRRRSGAPPSPARSSRPGSSSSSGTCCTRAVAHETKRARSRNSDAAREGVARVRALTLEPADEPALSLLRRAVRPALGRDPALRPLLDAVVADRGGRVERVLDVGARDVLDEACRQGIPDPHPRVAVGLQLHPYSGALRAGVAAVRAPQDAR